MFDKKHQTSIEEESHGEKSVTATKEVHAASQESFNIEKFKDRLYNMSQTAGKEYTPSNPKNSIDKSDNSLD